MATAARLVVPFATPTGMDQIRPFQLALNNIRESLQKLENQLTQVALQAGQSTVEKGQPTRLDNSVQAQIAALQKKIDAATRAGSESPAASTTGPTTTLLALFGEDGQDGDDGVRGLAGKDGLDGTGGGGGTGPGPHEDVILYDNTGRAMLSGAGQALLVGA